MKQENLALYIDADPQNKKQAAQLTSSNSIVGDFFKLKIDTKEQKVILLNKFDYEVAEIPKEFSKKIILLHNKNLEITALLAYVIYNEPESRHSANFLIAAYPKINSEALQNFLSIVSRKLTEGNRPNITLDEYECKKIVKNNGEFKIEKYLEKPKLEKGSVILKAKQTFMEKIIEASRQRKPGCYVASILFIIALIALIV